MKKQLLLSATILLSAGILFFTGCKKDDTSGPVITLNGSATEQSILNVAYTDPGATAEDNEDGVVAVTVSGKVDKDMAGPYTITYTASDAAGNTTTATRVVTVYNEASALAGNYQVYDSCGVGAVYNYAQVITASTTLNKRILFNKFADYKNNTSIYADVTATTINLPAQTATAIGTDRKSVV